MRWSLLLVALYLALCYGQAPGSFTIELGGSLTPEQYAEVMAKLKEVAENVTGETAEVSDVDECIMADTPCHENAHCENLPASYNCTCNAGFNDISDGDVSGTDCEDIDECDAPVDPCDTATSNCVNTPGSYTCNCNAGFEMVDGNCQDVNECADSTVDVCESLSVNYDCVNSEGSYTCVCLPGHELNLLGECEEASTCDVFAVVKQKALDLLSSLSKGEITVTDAYDEIATFTTTSFETVDYANSLKELFPDVDTGVIDTLTGYLPCDVSALCSYDTADLCTCAEGFTGTTAYCSDINECDGENDCDPNAGKCYNTIGSYSCKCKSGFVGSGLLGDCREMDEPRLSRLTLLSGLNREEIPTFTALMFKNSAPTTTCAGGLVETECDGQCRTTCALEMCAAVCSPGCTCPAEMVRTHSRSYFCMPQSDCGGPMVGPGVAFGTTNLEELSVVEWLDCIITNFPSQTDYSDVVMTATAMTDSFRTAAFYCVDFPNTVDFAKPIHISQYQKMVDMFLDSIAEFRSDVDSLIGLLEPEISEDCFDNDYGDEICPDAGDTSDVIMLELLPCMETQLKSAYHLGFITNLEEIIDYIAIEVIDFCMDRHDVLDYGLIFYNVLPVFRENVFVDMTDNIIDVFPGFDSLVYPPTLPISLLWTLKPQDFDNFTEFIDRDMMASTLRDYNLANPGHELDYTPDEMVDMLYDLIHAENFVTIIANNPNGFGYPFDNLTEFMDKPSFFESFTACHINAEGHNQVGDLECTCKEGWQGFGKGPTGCEDFNECAHYDEYDCPEHSYCANNEGSYTCECDWGYMYEGDVCVDVNECENVSNRCDHEAECVNYEGHYECHCPYELVDVKGDGSFCVDDFKYCKNDVSGTGENEPCDINPDSLMCKLATHYSTKAEAALEIYRALLFIPLDIPQNCTGEPLVSSSFESSSSSYDDSGPTVNFGDLAGSLPSDILAMIASFDTNQPIDLNELLARLSRKRRSHADDGLRLCDETRETKALLKARRYPDTDDEIELFHYEGHFQFFTTTACADDSACTGGKMQCQQRYSQQKAVTVKEVGGKLDIALELVYIPTSCETVLYL